MAVLPLPTCAPRVRPWTRSEAWEQTIAGPGLAAELDAVNVNTLTEQECTVYASAVQRQQAWTDALLMTTTARFVEARAEACMGVGEGSPVPGAERTVTLGGAGTPSCGSFAAAEWGQHWA